MNAAPADIDKLSGAIANCDGTSLQMAEAYAGQSRRTAYHSEVTA